MTTTLIVRAVAFSLFGLVLMACQKCPECPATPSVTGEEGSDNRGTFGTGSCDSGARITVPANAALAVYYDSNGQVAGTNAEELSGTEGKMMCPTEELPPDADPSACPIGKCAIPIHGKTYCGPCP